MSPFVGVSKQLLTVDELRDLLQKPSTQPSYYFLRWPHKVSGIVEQLPDDFLSPEGQMFNCDRELRWKQQRQVYYTVLLLSNTGQAPEFNPIGQEWEIENRPAYGYRLDETRFPQLFTVPEGLDIRNSQTETKTNKPKLAQRYFRDTQTATVHFVALTVEMPQ